MTSIEFDARAYDPSVELDLALVMDPGERRNREYQALTGVRQHTCVWQAMRDPFIFSVLREHRWWAKGCPTAPPGELPRALVDGIEIYDAILSRVLAHDRLAADKERERNNRKPAPGTRSARRAPPRPVRRHR